MVILYDLLLIYLHTITVVGMTAVFVQGHMEAVKGFIQVLCNFLQTALNLYGCFNKHGHHEI